MDLSNLLIILSIAFGVYAVGHHLWERTAPLRTSMAAGSVKKKRAFRAFKKRSEGSNVQNDTNAGSERQEAAAPVVNVQNVQTAPAAPAPPAGDVLESSNSFTLTPRELAQLGEALHLRREGATVEECLHRAFGVSKGGSEGYRRAKALYDAATAIPGAAPAGTYRAPSAPVGRRRTTARGSK